jgi:DNA-binding transcriptional regulator YdaS (Cro superfamily)
MEQLRNYLSRHGISQSAFAAMIGVNESTVSRYVQGPVRPSWATALRIERATSGAVPLSAWADEVQQ